MGCNPISRMTIRADRYGGCVDLVDSGEFDNVSEVIRFAVRVYWDHLRRIGPDAVPLVDRKGTKKVAAVRLDSNVVNGLMHMRLMSKGDIGDYALDFYLNEYRKGIQRTRRWALWTSQPHRPPVQLADEPPGLASRPDRVDRGYHVPAPLRR